MKPGPGWLLISCHLSSTLKNPGWSLRWIVVTFSIFIIRSGDPSGHQEMVEVITCLLLCVQRHRWGVATAGLLPGQVSLCQRSAPPLRHQQAAVTWRPSARLAGHVLQGETATGGLDGISQCIVSGSNNSRPRLFFQAFSLKCHHILYYEFVLTHGCLSSWGFYFVRCTSRSLFRLLFWSAIIVISSFRFLLNLKHASVSLLLVWHVSLFFCASLQCMTVRLS